MVPMDTFKWIVTGLLGTLLVGVGWFLSDKPLLSDEHFSVDGR